MSVTETLAFQNNDAQLWTVIATADADTQTAVVTHKLGANPSVSVVGLAASAALSGWYLSTINNTQWQMTKSTAAGSGAAGAQVRIQILRNG